MTSPDSSMPCQGMPYAAFLPLMGFEVLAPPLFGNGATIPPGRDINEAKRRWAELECKPIPAEATLMRHLFDRYIRDILHTIRQTFAPVGFTSRYMPPPSASV